jgi:SAM-dependent methyltransferase
MSLGHIHCVQLMGSTASLLMSMRIQMLALVCSSAAFGAGSTTPDAGLASDEVAVLMRRWYSAFDAKDTATLEALEHPKFEMQVMGIPAISAKQVSQISTVTTTTVLTRTFSDEHVVKLPSVAVYRGEVSVTQKNAAGTFGSNVSAVTATWERDSDGWKLLHLERIPGGLEGTRERWNEVFRVGTQYSAKPNKLLMEAISSRTPGKALDVGMGQGRNAIGMAEKGWSVTGVDISEVGVSKAMQAATDRGLKITGIIEDIEKFDFGKEQWDLIAFIYAGGRKEVERVKVALRPGGIVVVEMFHPEAAAQRPIGAGVVKNDTDDWSKLYAGWKILRYEEPVDISDWGLEKTRLVRFVAQKPERPTKN